MTGSRPTTHGTLGFIVLTAILAVSCGSRLMKLPAGPGMPVPDGDRAVTEATNACRAVSSITAELAASGSVGGTRLRARLLVGLATPSSVRLEAFAFGQRMFILVARGADATLLLTRDNRVLEHGRPDEILEAIAGIPLDASTLRTSILGCVEQRSAPTRSSSTAARQVGDDWRIVPGGPGELYLRRARRDAPWRLVAVLHWDPARPEWRAEYRDFENNLPRTIRYASSDATRFDVRLALSQVEINRPLDPTTFEIRIPPSADPITIEELRRSGPFATVNERSGAERRGPASAASHAGRRGPRE